MDDTYNVLIKYDLQFFAPKEGPGGEKTEPATAKKLRDERKKGHVAKSNEVNNAAMLISGFIALKVLVSFMGSRFLSVFSWIFNLIPEVIATDRGGLTHQTISTIFTDLGIHILIIVGPFFAIAVLVGVIVSVAQVQFVVSAEPLKPKFDKLNPISGFKRIFSKQKIFDLVLSIAKIFLIFYISYLCLKDHANELFILYDIPLNQAIALIGNIILDTAIRIALVYIVVAIADFIFQKYKFNEDMKMTKQEIKDEYKNTEGDPQIKGKQRQRMREASQRRMMQSVPEADVVITNPTHLAVALQFKEGVTPAPLVLAKGEDVVAKRIKDVAKENNIPIVENKALARQLYATVDVGEVIPPELYEVVAEILASIYLNR